MKTLQQIRDDRNLLEAEDKKLTTLIRAGLFDVHKLPLLKRALAKENTKTSPAERAALLDLLDALINQVTGSQIVFNKVRQNVVNEEDITEEMITEQTPYEVSGDLPVVLILRRKAVRTYPDGQRVALYWSDKLKTYVSVPYSAVGVTHVPGLNVTESVELVETLPGNNLEILQSIVEDNKEKRLIFMDESTLVCDPNTAKSLTEIYESLDSDNQKQMNETLNKNKISFMRIAQFTNEHA